MRVGVILLMVVRLRIICLLRCGVVVRVFGLFCLLLGVIDYDDYGMKNKY